MGRANAWWPVVLVVGALAPGCNGESGAEAGADAAPADTAPVETADRGEAGDDLHAADAAGDASAPEAGAADAAAPDAAPDAAAPDAAPDAGTPDAAASFRVLLYTRTSGHRHDSIPDGIAAFRALGAEHGFAVDQTEDPTEFRAERLRDYAAVVFLNTSLEVLDDVQQAAFEGYIRAGGGYVGVHAASNTEYEWPWYAGLVGAYVVNHPGTQQATVRFEDVGRPLGAGLPSEWVHTDELYDFDHNPRGQVVVLATLDEKTYQGGLMGADHPIMWFREYQGGRAWYTGLGHTPESYVDPVFRRCLLQGLLYAAGR